MKHKYNYSNREFLNDDIDMTAFIAWCIKSDIVEYANEDGIANKEPLEPDGVDAYIKIGDCSRIVELSFYTSGYYGKGNKLKKVENNIKQLKSKISKIKDNINEFYDEYIKALDQYRVEYLEYLEKKNNDKK